MTNEQAKDVCPDVIRLSSKNYREVFKKVEMGNVLGSMIAGYLSCNDVNYRYEKDLVKKISDLLNADKSAKLQEDLKNIIANSKDGNCINKGKELLEYIIEFDANWKEMNVTRMRDYNGSVEKDDKFEKDDKIDNDEKMEKDDKIEQKLCSVLERLRARSKQVVINTGQERKISINGEIILNQDCDLKELAQDIFDCFEKYNAKNNVRIMEIESEKNWVNY